MSHHHLCYSNITPTAPPAINFYNMQNQTSTTTKAKRPRTSAGLACAAASHASSSAIGGKSRTASVRSRVAVPMEKCRGSLLDKLRALRTTGLLRHSLEPGVLHPPLKRISCRRG